MGSVRQSSGRKVPRMLGPREKRKLALSVIYLAMAASMASQST
jgi:hypothetical protein